MSSISPQPPRRTDKVSDPLRRAFRASEPEGELPDAFQALLGRMRGKTAEEDDQEPRMRMAGGRGRC